MSWLSSQRATWYRTCLRQDDFNCPLQVGLGGKSPHVAVHTTDAHARGCGSLAGLFTAPLPRGSRPERVPELSVTLCSL
ncbi:unnamed protein product [Protopolystoma xenopodis]|uniref:Uncharacterized protein n=1 Tax=Protopolystoma xenopodis TaxID=117903 RepID=A0A3S4ZYW4_9PLAT|nr:unnamed protein product [Protopolystoma xenopodis]